MSEAKEPVILSPEKIPQHADDTDVLVDKIIGMVKGYSPNANTDMIYVAYKLAKSAHSHQFRRSGAPYIEHPVQLAYIAAQLSLDATAISAALLHDVVEDTPYTYENIETIFGKSVAELVDGVTKLRKIKYNTREEQQVENLRKMFLAMAKDIRVVIIKLIDRLHNMRTLNFMPRAKQLLISKETLDVYAPLAHRLGMSKIKIELEDLALKYLDPVAYEEIRQSINQKKDEREKYIRDIMDVLREKLDQMNIKSQVTGRAKHFYSIFRKMYTQNKTIDELYDLFAVRIIVDTVADCYAVLGMVHDLYTPVPMRFKDYIAMPKPNMYQSLHTTVIGPNGTPFEIQIRTWEMHRIAENGIAAHWKYKEGISGKTDMDSKLEWVRQLLDTQTNIIDTDDFFNTLKFDLFEEEVFVFTPQGKVISLPAKSTVIDFAFAIHSEVGYKMSGAKVNGKIVPNNYMVQNGEIVEILTANTHGPSRDWVKIVKTTEARNKIKQWFKKECREENIVNGKEDLDRELRANLLYNGFYENEEVQKNTLNKFSFNTVDELYAAIGYGGIMLTKVINKVKDDVGKLRRQREQAERAAHPQNEQQQRRQNKSSDGVVVEGIDNCLVKFARCCTPIPGDEIVGFVTRGYGVSIHRRDCVNVHIEEEPDRWVRAWWDEDMAANAGHVNKFSTGLQISTRNRIGVLSDVTLAFASSKINVHEISARDLNDGYGVINAMVDVTSVHQLDNMISRLRSIKGVVDVTRTVDTN